ncbi:hypothetical protein QJS10_CPA10g01178 [Acorus calamus]|uniref:NERD domain-containing protein n=1 Tax=Acorus calamus TaxID=4465 RepID=A0AAV9E0P3_ACOCL|nr:hypothetical protein QJS10_CPA10g01178 [Acorus calamus]
MWWEILCGLVIYRIIRSCFSDDDEFSDFDTSDSDLIFSVADKLEKIYGGKAFIGLRIPDADADAGIRRDIDIVLVTKQEAMVVAVKNLSGFVTVNKEGSWACTGGKKHKAEVLPDPVEEIRRQVAVLESYLEQRGVALPEGFLGCKLILPNPKCMITHSIDVLPEVVSYDKWTQLKSETKGGLSGWFKGAFRGGKNGLQDATYQKLHFTLGTAPMWDRLEVKGGRSVLGEFIEFKGHQEDMQALRNIKRSKVSRIMIEKAMMFGLIGRSRVQLLYIPRDYRTTDASASEWREIAVRSSVDVLFQPSNSKKVRKFKLTSLVSLSLGA